VGEGGPVNMRILYHHRTRSTDAQRIHIQEIVKAFEALGHEVEMVSLVPIDAGQNDAQRDAGDAWWKKMVRRIPFSYDLVQLGYNVVGLPMILAACLRKRADFIYERYSLLNFAGVLAARICRIPLILEVNSPFALEQMRDGEIRLRGLANWSERTICNIATHTIVVSTPLKRILEQAGVRAEKIEVMSNGVCLEHFQSQSASEELRRKLGLAGQTVVGFVGWFRKWHGLELLLEAFHRAGLAKQNVKVLMIGDGPAMSGLREFTEENRLMDSVVFTGPLPHAEIPPYLDAIDIAVQPAANEYCCPMKLLEYMALGKAIVAPRQENIQELLREGEEAEFFTPGDAEALGKALRRLVEDRDRARRFGERARAAITGRGFLWQENARRVIGMAQGGEEARAVAKTA
jgi:glycosyltransferase involved in cell wall biosynthesis